MKQICAPTISTFLGTISLEKQVKSVLRTNILKYGSRTKGATMSNEIYSHLKIIPQILGKE